MAKCNIHSHLLLQLILVLQIIILSQSNFLEALTLNYTSSGSQPRCVEAERKALLKFKANLTDPSGRLSSWVGEDCCRWVGVGCSNRTGNVVKLNLSTDSYNMPTSMLGGKLSPSLVELNHLNYLNLRSNNFNGTVPSQIGNLSNLQYFDLSKNYWLSVSDLNWLFGLTSIKYLNLDYVDLSKASTSWVEAIRLLPSISELHLEFCNLEYPFSFSIANLTSLSVIDLSMNWLVSEVPPFLFNITTLVSLDLSDCNITGPISHLPWHNLHNLEVLNLGSNSIRDEIGPFIDVLSEKGNSSLHKLILDWNSFSGQLGESLGRFTSLAYLSLYGNSISGEIPPSIGMLSFLTYLSLSVNSISGEIPPSIGMLSFLEELDLSWNKMNGSIPLSVGDLFSLITLDLSHNKMNGSIPLSVGDLSSLIRLGLSHNDWNGKLSKVHFKNLSKLKSLLVSCSGDFVFDVARDWIPPFSLETIRIIDCQLGPAFPLWIQTQTELMEIELSNAQISDTIPDWFWNLCTPQVWYLDLSSNKIGGVLPSSLQFHPKSYDSEIRGELTVDLRHNHLQGPIPLWSNVSYLYLGNNSFSGPIPAEIGTIMSSLFDLDLSLNFLNGTIPKSILKMGLLETLDLSKNNLFGKIPKPICSLPLIWLDLSNNSFDGKLPLSLKNCTNLYGLNLGGNKFSGNIPRWIGKGLTVLSLRMNKLTGDIPRELCHLPYLHALDLSHNNLSSTIPTCIGNLSGFKVSDGGYNQRLEAMDFFVKGRLLEYYEILYLLNIIDLSNNNLAGEIPEEITNLIALGTLNLSTNQLSGKIPEKIGGLKLIETLDLSHNRLSGLIPSSMASITTLDFLDLSYNNLSGPIPSSNQFSTFDNSIYEGNTGLCGPPLPTPCYSPRSETPNKRKDHKGKGTSKLLDDEMFWFCVSLGFGAIVGFWGFVGTLAIKKSWRIIFFGYFEEVYDWIFVFIVVNIARLKRKTERSGN